MIGVCLAQVGHQGALTFTRMDFPALCAVAKALCAVAKALAVNGWAANAVSGAASRIEVRRRIFS